MSLRPSISRKVDERETFIWFSLTIRVHLFEDVTQNVFTQSQSSTDSDDKGFKNNNKSRDKRYSDNKTSGRENDRPLFWRCQSKESYMCSRWLLRLSKISSCLLLQEVGSVSINFIILLGKKARVEWHKTYSWMASQLKNLPEVFQLNRWPSTVNELNGRCVVTNDGHGWSRLKETVNQFLLMMQSVVIACMEDQDNNKSRVNGEGWW